VQRCWALSTPDGLVDDRPGTERRLKLVHQLGRASGGRPACRAGPGRGQLGLDGKETGEVVVCGAVEVGLLPRRQGDRPVASKLVDPEPVAVMVRLRMGGLLPMVQEPTLVASHPALPKVGAYSEQDLTWMAKVVALIRGRWREGAVQPAQSVIPTRCPWHPGACAR
jgi:hypothetical protein